MVNFKLVIFKLSLSMLKYSDMLSKDFKIVYCYCTEENRDVIIEQYMATIFFRKDVSYRVKHIELLFIKM